MSQRTRIVLMFFVIYLLCMLVSGRYIWLTSYQALTQQHHSQLERFAGHIQNKLDKFAHIPQLLAKDEPLIDALLQPNNSAQIDLTNRYLEEVNAVIQAADTYLIDEYGNTIAASNWNIDRSFVDVTLHSALIFKQAIVGQRSQYFALGSTRANGLLLLLPCHLCRVDNRGCGG